VTTGQLRPTSKAARQARVVEHLTRHAVHSQGELVALLASDGVAITQATLSRDLVELGAIKVRDGNGGLVYAVPGEGGDRSLRLAVPSDVLDARLTRLCEDLLVTAEASANLVLLRTPPGAAQLLASAIDHSSLPDVLGSVAGDDTVLVITRTPTGGDSVARRFLDLASGGEYVDPPTDQPDDLLEDHFQPKEHQP
jgi:transcriptional regulator of arginine metabolism